MGGNALPRDLEVDEDAKRVPLDDIAVFVLDNLAEAVMAKVSRERNGSEDWLVQPSRQRPWLKCGVALERQNIRLPACPDG